MNRLTVLAICAISALAVAAEPSTSYPSHSIPGISRVLPSTVDERVIVHGAVDFSVAASRSDVRNSKHTRKHKGLDSKETEELERYGGILPSYLLSPAARKSVQLGIPVASASKELQLPASPAPLQVLTTVENSIGVTPDSHGAVGPMYLLTALNNGMWVTSRPSGSSEFVNWGIFWESVLPTDLTHHALYDPRALYDAQNDRYIVTLAYYGCGPGICLKQQQGSVLVAASASNDPNGAWRVHRIPLHDGDNYWVDFPNTGQNSNQIVVSINSVKHTDAPPHLPIRTQLVMLDKAGLYEAGQSLNLALFNVDSSAYGGGVFYPAASSDSEDSLGLLTANGVIGAQEFYFHRIRRTRDINGNSDGAMLDLGLSSFTSGLSPAHALPLQNLALGATERPHCNAAPSLVERNGEIWFVVMAAFPNIDHSVSGLHWAQVQPDSGVVIQYGSYSRAHEEVSQLCPSIAVNMAGDMLIGASQVSAQSYLSAIYFFRAASDPPGALRSAREYEVGQSPITSHVGNTFVRLGDYSHTMLDPTDTARFWTIQERANAANQAAVTWAQVQLLGVDLEVRFEPGCQVGMACKVTVRNIGTTSAPASAGMHFRLSSELGSLDLARPPGWRCVVTTGSDLQCYKKDPFAVGDSATFTYSYTGSEQSTLLVSGSTVDEVAPGNNAAEWLLLATH